MSLKTPMLTYSTSHHKNSCHVTSHMLLWHILPCHMIINQVYKININHNVIYHYYNCTALCGCQVINFKLIKGTDIIIL